MGDRDALFKIFYNTNLIPNDPADNLRTLNLVFNAYSDLLEYDPSLANETDYRGGTVLHSMATRWSYGSLINQQNYAVARNIVQLLSNSFSVQTSNGMTALHLAHRSDNYFMFSTLLDLGADPNCYECPQTVIQVAPLRLATNFMQKLVDHGGNVNGVGRVDKTPVLQKFAKVYTTTSFSLFGFSIVPGSDFSSVLRFLLELGANPFQKNGEDKDVYGVADPHYMALLQNLPRRLRKTIATRGVSELAVTRGLPPGLGTSISKYLG